MTNTSSYTLENSALPLPIPQTALRTAIEFARQQPTPEKAEQVKLNTLAVAVVSNYLQLMEIPTEVTAGDSWNPIARLCSDVADLVLPGMGRLECRPVRPQASVCTMPAEVWEDRLGYLVVEIDEASQAAAILGFVPQVASETVSLHQLQPPEALLDCLAERQSLPLPDLEGAIVQLSQWARNRFEEGWQTVEALFNADSTLALGFRNLPTAEEAPVIRRARALDLGILMGNRTIALIVEIQPEANQQTSIRLKVCPVAQPYLPADVSLTVLDDSGATFLEATSRAVDNYIQLQFSGTIGERFNVRLTYGDAQITEAFVI